LKIKKRLDVLLVERLYADSRTKAQAIIMSGNVYVNGQKADKPGTSFEETVEIEVPGGVGEQHVGILKNFTNHILNGEPLLAPGMEGVNGLSICNAMMLSSWTNQWVEVKNDGEEFWAHLQEKIKNSKAKEDSGVVFDTEGTYGNK
jgi:ribosomal protein S4